MGYISVLVAAATIQSGMSVGDIEGEKKYGHHTEKTLIKYVDSLGHLY